MREINSGKVVIIPDFHQGLAFVDAIFEKEKDFDKIVMMGDELDTFRPIDNILYFSVKEVCKWINSKLDDDRFVWLLGNHTLSYLATYNPSLIPPKGSFYSCSGWTRSKAKDFNHYIDPKWFKKIELCCKVGSYFCVHGGFSYDQFKPYMSEEENIQDLYSQWETDKLTFKHSPYHWIGYVGPYRYGTDKYSSPVWLDWNEFVPMDNIQMICSHTNQLHWSIREKKNGEGLSNYCIDCDQQMYAVWEEGEIRFESIEEKDYNNFLKL